MNQEQQFRNRINTLSLILAVLVVFFHSNAYLHESHDIFACKFQFFICEDLAQGAVPTFFAISGFLFYRNFDLSQLKRKWHSRVFSLVIPYLIWNAVYMLYMYVVCRLPFVDTEAFPLDALHLAKGIFLHEYNGPFWYMFQLILLTALCPVLYALMKRKATALLFMAAMFALFALDIKDLWILQTRAVVYYSLGMFFALHAPQRIVAQERIHPAAVAAFLLSQLLVYSSVATQPVVYISIRLLMIVAYANFSVLLRNIRLPGWLLCSFPIYAMHDLFVETLNKVFSFFVSPASNWILLDFFITTAVSVGLCIGINEFLKRYLPRMQSILFGGRTR